MKSIDPNYNYGYAKQGNTINMIKCLKDISGELLCPFNGTKVVAPVSTCKDRECKLNPFSRHGRYVKV